MAPNPQYFGTPNQPGQGAATPGASTPKSLLNASMQQKPAGGDPFAAVMASAQAWNEKRRRGGTTNKPNAAPAGGPSMQQMRGRVNPDGSVSTAPNVFRPPSGSPPPPVPPGAPMEGASGFDAGTPYNTGIVPPSQGGSPVPPPPGMGAEKRARPKPGGGFAPGGGGIPDGDTVKQLFGEFADGRGLTPAYMAAAAKDGPPPNPPQAAYMEIGGGGGLKDQDGDGQPDKPWKDDDPNAPPGPDEPEEPKNPTDEPKDPAVDPDKWWRDQAANHAKTPGFEFLKSHPEVFQMFAGDMARQGLTGKGPTFEEWAGHNWEDIVAKTGMSPESAKNFGYFVRKKGYEKMAERLRDEMRGKNPKGGVDWVDEKITEKYDTWARYQKSIGNKEPLDFWTWAGSVNLEKPDDKAPEKKDRKPLPGSRVRKNRTTGEIVSIWDGENWVSPDGQTIPGATPPGGNGGTSGSGGSGGGSSPTSEYGGGSHTEAGGGVTGDPENDYLKRLETAMKERQSYVMGEADRAFQAQAALKGLGKTGAYGDAYGDFMANASSQFNEQLAKPVWDAYENEQTRRNQAAMSRYSSDSSLAGTKYGADASAGSAHAMAGSSLEAAKYNAQLDYNLGLQQLGQQSYNNDWDRQFAMMQFLNSLGPQSQFLQMFGNNPGQYGPSYSWMPGYPGNGGR